MSARADKLAEDLAALMAGERLDDTLMALIGQLAATIGFASQTKWHAQKICDDLPGDLMRSIERTWAETRRCRALPQESLRNRRKQ